MEVFILTHSDWAEILNLLVVYQVIFKKKKNSPTLFNIPNWKV